MIITQKIEIWIQMEDIYAQIKGTNKSSITTKTNQNTVK